MWFLFSQNNSGGVFNYNKDRGISVNVFVEADNVEEANEIADHIGLYFDGYMDCSCCGDRWSRACDWDAVSEDIVPMQDEDLVKDDNSSDSPFIMKWRPSGEYESFVHPKNADFYGAHAYLTHIPRVMTGYGLWVVNGDSREVFEVGDDGYTVNGYYQAPAPLSKNTYLYEEIKELESGVRVGKTRGMENSVVYWSDDRKKLEEIVNE